METLKIKPKYFMAIMHGIKQTELRHKPIKENTLVKLVCEGVGHLYFISGICLEPDFYSRITIDNFNKLSWWDEFCEEYCKEKPTYLIEIKDKSRVEWY